MYILNSSLRDNGFTVHVGFDVSVSVADAILQAFLNCSIIDNERFIFGMKDDDDDASCCCYSCDGVSVVICCCGSPRSAFVSLIINDSA